MKKYIAFVSILLLGSPALAQKTFSFGGLRVPVSKQRLKSLKKIIPKLQALKGYVSVFKGEKHAGAVPIAVVHKTDGSLAKWTQNIGKVSVGFGTGSMPISNKLIPAYVRVGETLYHYKALRTWDPKAQDKSGNGYKAAKVKEKGGAVTEVTYLVDTKKEMPALETYFLARHHDLIQSDGKPIRAVYKINGDQKNFRTEGCGSACTSVFNDLWLTAFSQSLPKIQEYGRKKGIPALANAKAGMVDTLKTFRDRTGGLQQGPKQMVRTHFPHADMLTVINPTQKADKKGKPTGDRISDPINQLKWARGGWLEMSRPKSGPTATPAVFDMPAPGKAPKKHFQGTRVSLGDFAQALSE